MSFFSNAIAEIESAEQKIASFFTSHHAAIQDAVNDLSIAGNAAVAVTAVAAPGALAQVTTAVNKINAAATLAAATANSISTADSLSGAATALTTAASELQGTGIIGGKAQAAINTVTAKVTGVASALTTAAASVPPQAPVSN